LCWALFEAQFIGDGVGARFVTQLPRVRELEAQREAMKKLGFLVGIWAGEARLLRGPGEWAGLIQTQEVEYQLDGLIMVIEGVGRTKSGGQRFYRHLE
jgi:hypothetical protein